ncbi:MULTISPECIES: holo-ACP synthase [unclassified Clostridium]|jgi:holo-[acyl-carrier protein] synthase|uniref:holo-ACP synthase n=1 Tax=Clostridium TaxID=1485 RepID=UPI001C8C8D71|nr:MULTISPECIES: holo-ACP synthase [unclassified Clostridium]MBX9138994.1 holo-ACP synthase [Clostridium sp. K12(2020)]MBX9145454.1 holo-ACP synthase [Clostridium sp. K13]MDU2290476.1 holo-ACP synthase [Clostridium celatum]MDU4323906.1 holo-ACP synthase [Clostridium celatum]
MILGIGTDIIEIDRISRAIDNTPMFLEKIFTKREIEQLTRSKLRVESVAGNFAVKEAVSKALGTGVRGFNFKDIEVLRDELGKPVVEVSDKIKELIKVNNYLFNVSISHNRTCAIAFVVLESQQST